MNKLISSSLLILLFFLIVFTRSFAGIYIFGIRLGEYLVAFGLISSLVIFFLPNKFLKAPKLIHNIFRLIIISFFITLLVTDASFFERYTYKTSSYIWTVAYFFIGYYFLEIRISSKVHYVFLFGLLVLYVFGTGNYPDALIIWFKEVADKFTFVKASDMVLATVLINLISLNKLKKSHSYLIFIISVSTFVPLITQMSRMALASLVAFTLIYLFLNFKFIFFNIRNSVILLTLGPLIFFISTFRVTQFDFASLPSDSLETVKLVTVVNEELEKINRIHDNTQIDTFMSLYFEQRYVPNQAYNNNNSVLVDTGWHNKLISTDGTFNWRLSMWQDLYYYQASENSLIFGYGYNEVLPVFNLAYDSQNIFRVGHDKSNEHVHNYLVNIFGRGGISQLFLFSFLHFIMYFLYYKKFKSHNILLLVVPTLLNSMTDIAMEGVQFPINFYLLYGYFFSEGINLKTDKINI